jgi:hypothetical protein
MTNLQPPIVCKPTRWFLFRALVMLLMFGVFAVLFFIDGSTGYRKKNLTYFIHETFKASNDEFARLNADGSLTPDQWRAHAMKQSVRLPEDRSILPAGMQLPMPWPPVLHDFERMKPLQWNQLWLEYSKDQGFDSNPPEKPYDARKIDEQWVVFWICLTLALGAAFFLIRTMRRSVVADVETLTGPDGRRIPYPDLKVLDLRKWDTKGLAFIDYDGPSGKGRIRLDGLTYGGFRKEDGEPAERLMQLVRSRFSGEILEYVALAPEDSAPGTGQDSN